MQNRYLELLTITVIWDKLSAFRALGKTNFGGGKREGLLFKGGCQEQGHGGLLTLK